MNGFITIIITLLLMIPLYGFSAEVESLDDDSTGANSNLITGEVKTNTSKDTPCALGRSFNPKIEMQELEQTTEDNGEGPATGRI
ncbi:MAG: hypothetical protein HQK50_04325 [Oligoflexia bacterium]|nr:hypothetical protein [Oligoflexia bacterium]MBF0364771.1 hypothetical protein [Oligoflexia bacterium]